jgi:hypothetical protein
MAERTCATCGRPGPIELEMTVGGGQTLTLLSCSRCETRSWLADGEPVSMDDVLKITAGDPDFTVSPSPTTQRRSARR